MRQRAMPGRLLRQTRWLAPLAATAALSLAVTSLNLRPSYDGFVVDQTWPGETWDATVHDDHLLLVGHRDTTRLLRGDEEVAIPWTPGDRHDCAFADVDDNGLTDIFCAHGADRGAGSEPNDLWMQYPDGWREEAEDRGLANPLARSRAAVFLGGDLFVGTRTRQGYPSTLYRQREGRYEAIRTIDQDVKRAVMAGETLVTVGEGLRWYTPTLDMISSRPGDWVAADYEGGRLAAIEGFDDVVIFQGHTEVARYPMPGDAFDVAWTDAGLYVVIGDLNGKENPRDVLIRHGRLYTVPIDMPGLGMSATAVPDGGVIVGNGWLTSDGGFVLLQRMQHAARSGVHGDG